MSSNGSDFDGFEDDGYNVGGKRGFNTNIDDYLGRIKKRDFTKINMIGRETKAVDDNLRRTNQSDSINVDHPSNFRNTNEVLLSRDRSEKLI